MQLSESASLALDLRHDVAAASRARAAVAELFERIAMPPELAQDCLLVTSELVTNAIRHGGAPARLEVVGKPGYLLLKVHDTSDRRPEQRENHTGTEGGRGLRLVEALTTAWGCDSEPGRPGKHVWAEVVW